MMQRQRGGLDRAGQGIKREGSGAGKGREGEGEDGLVGGRRRALAAELHLVLSRAGGPGEDRYRNSGCPLIPGRLLGACVGGPGGVGLGSLGWARDEDAQLTPHSAPSSPRAGRGQERPAEQIRTPNQLGTPAPRLPGACRSPLPLSHPARPLTVTTPHRSLTALCRTPRHPCDPGVSHPREPALQCTAAHSHSTLRFVPPSPAILRE